ncbi:MAG TPA: hypothetical protein VE944_21335 [Nostoc sp.]|uniref:hypothetical protein n=1 Tax=Nostoc sp. TaxID=1180 RepID=UPI002D4750C5|nr:hypothetical protein [Nostoc sp.]HYX16844.1 hypothetical protein [Nostoc sp.]
MQHQEQPPPIVYKNVGHQGNSRVTKTGTVEVSLARVKREETNFIDTNCFLLLGSTNANNVSVYYTES